jgi:hypothetical protein
MKEEGQMKTQKTARKRRRLRAKLQRDAKREERVKNMKRFMQVAEYKPRDNSPNPWIGYNYR